MNPLEVPTIVKIQTEMRAELPLACSVGGRVGRYRRSTMLQFHRMKNALERNGGDGCTM